MIRLCASFVLLVPLWLPSLRAEEPTYWNDVRPILRKHCTVCHSARNLDEVDISGGLALDSYEAVVKNTKKPVLQIGKSSQSPLIQLVIEPDEDKRMPRSSPRLP